MKQLSKICLSAFVFSILIMSVGVSAISSSYHIYDNLDVDDINVFLSNSKNIVLAEGTYNAKYSDGYANGHLHIKTLADDNSIDVLKVKWNSNTLGITITQDDQYAVKFIANAKVTLNGVVKHNQPVYVHYNRLNGGLVVRGRGFRFAIM